MTERKSRGDSAIQMSPKGDGTTMSLLAPGTEDAPLFTVSNVLLGLFSAMSVAAVVVIIVLVATKDDSVASPTLSTFTPCSFRTAFTNWNNYGFNASEVTCPVAGAVATCVNDEDCTSIDPLCLPGGGNFYLSCLDVNVSSGAKSCGYDSFTMPGLTSAGGVCNTSDVYGTCAYCNSTSCAGQAVCVKSTDCSNKKFVCYPSGNSIV